MKTSDGQDIPSVLELAGKADALTGKIDAMGKSVDVTAEVSGSNVEVSFEGAAFGQPGAFSMTLEISGDNATGSGSGPSGALTVTGSRTKKPSAGATPPASSEAAPPAVSGVAS